MIHHFAGREERTKHDQVDLLLEEKRRRRRRRRNEILAIHYFDNEYFDFVMMNISEQSSRTINEIDQKKVEK